MGDMEEHTANTPTGPARPPTAGPSSTARARRPTADTGRGAAPGALAAALARVPRPSASSSSPFVSTADEGPKPESAGPVV